MLRLIKVFLSLVEHENIWNNLIRSASWTFIGTIRLQGISYSLLGFHLVILRLTWWWFYVSVFALWSSPFSVPRLRCSFVAIVEKGNEIFVWSKSYHFIKKRRQSTHSHIKTQLASTCGISRNESDWRNHIKFIGRSTHALAHTERQTHGKWFTWVWVSQTTGDRGVFGRRRASCVGLVNWPKLSAPKRERESWG